MKGKFKINSKGFTLVELLAVIIILAIVVGITIPAVLTMVDDARKKAGSDAAAVMADWVDKQYSLELIGIGQPSAAFTAICNNSNSTCTSAEVSASSSTTGYNDFVKAAGLTPNDIEWFKLQIVGDRACVKIKAASGGNFYINRTGDGINEYQSVNCSTTTSSSGG